MISRASIFFLFLSSLSEILFISCLASSILPFSYKICIFFALNRRLSLSLAFFRAMSYYLFSMWVLMMFSLSMSFTVVVSSMPLFAPSIA